MHCEQAFGEKVDNEQVFVLQWTGSEQVFGQGDAMSVAFELEHEVFYPRLQVVPTASRRTPSHTAVVQRRRLVLGLVVVALLVLLALPIRALAGQTIASAAPTAGQEYIVHSGDTLQSIAARVDSSDVAGLAHRLAIETGSTVVVPGEHLLIP
jgi:hypothetical protein